MSDFIEIAPVEFKNDSFTVDKNREQFTLNGTYTICRYKNPNPNLEDVVLNHYTKEPGLDYKQIFIEGNLLYKLDEPNIQDMIDLLIRCTYEDEFPDYVDTSVNTSGARSSRSVKEVLYRFEGKLNALYGRYIFGYENPFVSFTNDTPSASAIGREIGSSSNSTGDYSYYYYPHCYCDPYKYERAYVKTLREPKLTREEIILPVIPFTDDIENPLLNGYNHGFSIVDETTKVLTAFAVYR